MKTLLVVLLAGAASAFAADPLIDSCGTGPQIDAKLASLERWMSGRDRGLISSAAEMPASVSDGIFVVPSNDLNSPFLKPNDLAETSIYFQRNEDGSFTASRRSLPPLSASQPPTHTFRKNTNDAGWALHSYQLRNFSFPFFERNVSSIQISAYNAIYLESPAHAPFYQFGPLEAITQPTPVIAPLLLTESHPAAIVSPNLYINETAEALSISWQTPGEGGYFRYHVQAILFRNGDIQFAWRELGVIYWGTVLITSGQEEVRQASAVLSSATDAIGDVDPRTEAVLAPMLDIESAEVSRVSDTNLLRIQVRFAAPIDRTTIRSDSPLQVFVDFSDTPGSFTQYLLYTVNATAATDSFFISGWGSNRRSPAASIDGNTVTVHFLQDQWRLPPSSRAARVATSHLVIDYFTDQMPVTVEMGSAARPVETDLSVVSTGTPIEGPVLESFTVPVFNPRMVWDQMKSDFNLRDDEVDGVAMYQNYMTDVMFFAGAYSTVGNPGVDGIGVRNGYGQRFAKVPALLHMNTWDYGWNATDRGSTSVSLHEFGHRWLYHLRIRQNGETTRALNPTTAHPAEFVHTPAPFTVYSVSDASTMGGSRWTDHGDGSFASAPFLGYYSYSWMDLYLMGLAAPEEVEPFFYIENSSPALRNEYTPAPNTRVTGTRRDVVIQQVIDALGARNPSPHQAPRLFTVYFVLVTEPGAEVSAAQIAKMDKHRRTFEESFRMATGGRAEVRTYFREAGGPRRRPVRP